MSNLLLELNTMQDAGFNQDDIESGKSILVQEMLDAGFSDDDIKKELGITDSNDEGLIAPMITIPFTRKSWHRLENGSRTRIQ